MRRLLFLPFLLLFAGCGAVGSSRPVAPAAPATPNATRTVAVPRPKTYVPDRVIASRSAELGYASVELAIMHLERTGATTALAVRLTNNDDTFSADVGDIFDDGATQPIRNSDSNENEYSVDGIYLLDRAHGQKYLVARDPDGRCICDTGLNGRSLYSDGSVTLSATYGAPPPNVTAVDVVVPRFGTFANVPLG
jgi:hypothetical protein